MTDPIAEALDRFVPAFPSAEGDWQAILSAAAAPAGVVPSGKIPVRRSLRRSGFWRRVPARVALVAAVVALAAVVTAVAFGWPQRVVDFFSSPPAPTHVKNWFSAVNAKAPPGMNPLAISGETKKITTRRFNAGARGARPRLHTLYVAPTKGGGFCFQWTRFPIRGNCGDGKGIPATAPRWLRAYGPLWLKLQGSSSTYFWQNGSNPYFVFGTVGGGATRKVEARFADGTTATIQPTWVGPPINAGFIAYPVPRSHWDNAHALTSVVALDANGRVIGSRSPPGSSVMAGMRMTMPPTTTVVAGKVAVPNLIDLRLDLAERTLARDHLRFNGFGDNPPERPDIAKHYWVCFQSPKAGKRASTGTRVALLSAPDCHQGPQGHQSGQGLP